MTQGKSATDLDVDCLQLERGLVALLPFRVQAEYVGESEKTSWKQRRFHPGFLPAKDRYVILHIGGLVVRGHNAVDALLGMPLEHDLPIGVLDAVRVSHAFGQLPQVELGAQFSNWPHT